MYTNLQKTFFSPDFSLKNPALLRHNTAILNCYLQSQQGDADLDSAGTAPIA